MIDGRYRITGELGHGGMGTVYRGEHLTIRRPVAIKILHPELSHNAEFNRRFEREAFASGRVDHPNCVTVSDFGHLDDGGLYLVMELVDGEPLADVLEREQRLAWPRALHIIRHVMRGLRHAHRAGVVHRDLKPENVILAHHDDDPDFAKILDFGIAKLVGVEAPEAEDKLTRTGFAVGTPKYMPPELAFGQTITASVDIYAASVVLFEMLTGVQPYVADDQIAILTMHATAPIPSVQTVAPDAAIPPAVDALVSHGLAKKPADRVPDADAYIAAIDGIIGPAVRASTTPPPAPMTPTADLGEAKTGLLRPMGSAPTLAATPSAPMPTVPNGPPEAVAAAGTQIVWTKRRKRFSLRSLSRYHIIAGVVIALLLVGVFASQGQSAEATYRDAVKQLTEGETCEARREAVITLRNLGKKSAIKPLRRARYRMRGGVLGMGDHNTNKCLQKDAEEAIRALER
ncbi:MAG TPA: serine/threonine-protein kinase [Kofleriaceae bacterium]|nr:serine/threonine-protein kinase [Kofleriaceae bacterium]